ncbi:unnamed protein product [Adineta steineri]|uniref:Homeobox domain-containing protein n=1 Tax=Adineta steineri TaxID=433720 RepID=A0A814WD95_9BILA|nr:unnamed protein product [Adineta steineri]CAF0954625.1 unnamed protein product [Adineta steineri]CAF1014489.1 unnamed protein product [Adineta steineri]CAF1199799.1 unnamed protein product [Adineta steineri]CAF3668441.1 unnamed protein product [Adineta steineri]
MTFTDKPLPFSIDDILKYEKSKTSIYSTIIPRSYQLPSLIPSSYLSFATSNKHSCSEHRSTSCNSSLHNCHLSALQLNSTYPNMDTFIHHRRCRRTRTVFSDAQLLGLEKRFETQKYLSTPDRIELADLLHLSQLQVKTWYQNRRMKWKKLVLQQGCKEAPTKPKGRPKKNSIPSYAELQRIESEKQISTLTVSSSCTSDDDENTSHSIHYTDDDDDDDDNEDQFIDIEQ